MVHNMSPRKNMSLRTTIKHPKPFSGDILDDLSSSILGGRILDNSEIEDTSAVIRSVPPAPTRSNLEHVPRYNTGPKQSARAKKCVASKKRLLHSTAKELPPLPTQWAPGLEMTPANNKRYLGPQLEYNDSLAPAAFPTLDTDELVNSWQEGLAPYIPKVSTQRHRGANTLGEPNTSSWTSNASTHHQKDAKDAILFPKIQAGTTTSCLVNDSYRTPPEQRAGNRDRESSEIWEELSIHHRLELVDSVVAAFDPPPSPHQIFQRLQLTVDQVVAMNRTLKNRLHKNETENRALQMLMVGTKDHLMNSNTSVSQEKLRYILDHTIYRNICQDDHLVTKPNDLRNAKLLLSRFGLPTQHLTNASPIRECVKREDSAIHQPNPTSRPQIKQRASNSFTQNHAVPENSQSPSPHDQPNIPLAPRTTQICEVTDQYPEAPQLASMWSLPSTLGSATTIMRRAVDNRSPLSARLQWQRDHAVDATLKSSPETWAGTASISRPGLAGVSPTHIIGPMGDLNFEDWAKGMEHRYQNGDKMIGKNPKSFLSSITTLDREM